VNLTRTLSAGKEPNLTLSDVGGRVVDRGVDRVQIVRVDGREPAEGHAAITFGDRRGSLHDLIRVQPDQPGYVEGQPAQEPAPRHREHDC
jgi:hypothetical protein